MKTISSKQLSDNNKKATLLNYVITDDNVVEIIQLLNDNPNIVSIHLLNSSFTLNKPNDNLLDAIASHPNLTTIEPIESLVSTINLQAIKLILAKKQKLIALKREILQILDNQILPLLLTFQTTDPRKFIKKIRETLLLSHEMETLQLSDIRLPNYRAMVKGKINNIIYVITEHYPQLSSQIVSIEENDKLPVIQGTMARIITKLQNQTPATPTVFPKQHESNNINSNNQLTINIKTNKIVSFEDPIGTPESITAMLSIKDYDCENEPIKSIGDKLTQKTGLKNASNIKLMIRNSKISIASLIELQKLLAKPIKELHFDNTQIINKEPTTKGNKIEILTLTFEHCRTLTNDGLAQLTVLFCPKQMYIDWASSKYIDINRTQYTLPHTNLFLVHFPFIFKHQVQPHEKRFAINDMKFYIQHTKRLLPTLEISQNLMACYQTINAHINLIEQSKSNNLPKLTLLKLILAKQIDSEVSSKDSLDLFMETYENCNKYMLRMIYESDRIEDFFEFSHFALKTLCDTVEYMHQFGINKRVSNITYYGACKHLANLSDNIPLEMRLEFLNLITNDPEALKIAVDLTKAHLSTDSISLPKSKTSEPIPIKKSNSTRSLQAIMIGSKSPNKSPVKSVPIYMPEAEIGQNSSSDHPNLTTKSNTMNDIFNKPIQNIESADQLIIWLEFLIKTKKRSTALFQENNNNSVDLALNLTKIKSLLISIQEKSTPNTSNINLFL